MINIIYDVVLLISTSSMAYEQIMDSVLLYTRMWNILYVAYSYLNYVNVEVSGKTEMQLIIKIFWEKMELAICNCGTATLRKPFYLLYRF